jgi:hypothetical protein
MWFRQSPELCEDGVGGLCPEGRARVCVLSSDVGTDGLLEVGEGLEDAASDGPSGEGGEEVLDGVEP